MLIYTGVWFEELKKRRVIARASQNKLGPFYAVYYQYRKDRDKALAAVE
jgi:hypothetical protein